ncbi:hypothetical protein [Sphingobacterium sp. IITKGP-BTPF85]|uniref:hypothetical protein n=1 Tax=Sphingobacterium sp. IITKGP-BTPF85 TaxID=1338009 RepID=UPI0003F726F7|nr:hypothetical protein [Sphingobacterium sp. IITKGP-BTPF85]
MTIEESFYIGYISKTRGLKGELQLFFEFEDYQDLDFDVLFAEVNKISALLCRQYQIPIK